MQVARVVAVHAPDERGSGYLIAPRLVLTSAHVVGAAKAVGLVVGGEREPVRGRVVWRGTPKGSDDAALVEIPAGRRAGPVRWGRIATSRPGTRCETRGFPRWVLGRDRKPDQWHSSGFLNPGSGYFGDRYVMTLDGTPPAPIPGIPSPWGGYSGAALFCGQLLIGVLVGDWAGAARGSLSAVPANAFTGISAFREVLWHHEVNSPLLEPAEMQDLAELDPPPANSVGLFLRARGEVVGFRGRQDTMAELNRWTAGAGPGVLLLHGPGGQGKTRVAQELCRRLAEQRWASLWLSKDAPEESLGVVADAEIPLLVVVDYAEARSTQLRALFRAAAGHDGGTPLRFLLLARAAGDWWRDLRKAGAVIEEFLDGAPAIRLPAIEREPAGQADAYREAVVDLANALTRQPAFRDLRAADLIEKVGVRPAGLDPETTALTLHMTALADLLDVAVEARGSAEPPVSVEDRLLVHEERYWFGSAADLLRTGRIGPGDLRDALTAATLLGAENRRQADALLAALEALAGNSKNDRQAVRDWIAGLYPPTDNRFWGGLQPDRLAERFVAIRLTDDPELVDPLVPAASPRQLTQFVNMYARAAGHPASDESLGRELTAVCLRHRQILSPYVVDAASFVEQPGPLLAVLHRLPHDPAVTLDDLAWVEGHIHEVNGLVAKWAVDIYQTLIGMLLRQAPGSMPDALALDLALYSSKLSMMFDALGDRTGAATAARQAVDWQRPIARDDDARARLASFLSNLAIILGRLGEHAESLAVVDEAYEIHARLVRDDAAVHRAGLAAVLGTRAHRLADLGRLADAADAAQQAVEIWRKLAEDDSARYAVRLAAALNAYSVHLTATGRHPLAFLAAQEAVDRLRTLTADRPSNLVDLARALTTYANCLGRRGLVVRATIAMTEAADIFDRLVAAGLTDVRSELAGAQHNLAVLVAALSGREG